MKKLTLLATLLLSSQFALADGSGIPGTEDNPEILAVNSPWKISLGGGVASVPRYEGAATNRLRAVPLLEMSNGHFFAGTSRGIGYNFSDDKSVQYGLRVTMAQRRKQSFDAHLNGMGDIAAAAELGGFVNARFAPWYVTSSIAGSSRGSRFELGGGYELTLSAADQLRAGLEMNWGNGKYMQTYFGVSAAQSAASGGVLTAYNATSGVKDYSLKLNWMHSYSKEWFSNAGLSLKQLSGGAKSSPLTMRNSANTVNFVVGYNF
jgi:outer membrane scaffolding protein for murein synthesis (MipA/OmpV family)